jgi:hypothetical protein
MKDELKLAFILIASAVLSIALWTAVKAGEVVPPRPTVVKPGDVPMPAVAVLILCKSEPAPEDANQNDADTKRTPRKWVYENSMMVCRKEETPLNWIPGALNPTTCQRSAIMEMVNYEQAHPTDEYQPWRVACPSPVVDTGTGRIIDWVMPGCGHKDTVKCEGEDIPI